MSDAGELKPSNTGLHLIETWAKQRRERRRIEHQLETAKQGELNAQHAIGEWLIPEDAGLGESFTLAVGNGFLSVRKTNNGCQAHWRTPPTGPGSDKVYVP